MANIVANISLGEWAEKFNANPTNAVVLLLRDSVESDALLRDYDNVQELLAGANTEANFTNYARKSTTETDVTVTTNDTDDRKELSMGNLTWTAAGGTLDNTLVKLVLAYNGGAGDANLQVVAIYDFATTTTGVDLIAQMGEILRGVSVN